MLARQNDGNCLLIMLRGWVAPLVGGECRKVRTFYFRVLDQSIDKGKDASHGPR